VSNLFKNFIGIAAPLIVFSSAILVACSIAHPREENQPENRMEVDQAGTVTLPSTAVPLSIYMSDEAKKAFVAKMQNRGADYGDADIATRRGQVDKYFFGPLLTRALSVYPVLITQEEMGGVRTASVLPKYGVSPENAHRVLINLHGGSFSLGAGLGGLVESVPIAGVGKFRVITVDYRQGPENKFPAASEDVEAVYRVLLKQYKPKNIGIFGCSSGGSLAAMSIAWFQERNLPLPGAVGIFCAGADEVHGGDSSYMIPPLVGEAPPTLTAEPSIRSKPYFIGTDDRNPLVSPVFFPAIISKFPPTLLITGTRASELSSAAYTHSQLNKFGVEAELHVWDGMWHAFFYDVDLPESKEAFNVIVKFFDKHLLRNQGASD
jgi:epsilon-lactone hydrolase